jgi:lipopolysaccharide/colanic/teichoic acid biosynthesis glycosyltransferase
LTGEAWEAHYIQQVMPEKLAIDMEYVRSATVWQDSKIIVSTLRAMIFQKVAASAITIG